MKLSVCFIVKNEEKVLARALVCAQKFADEIVVADTGSTDETVKIAREFTSNIYYFSWNDDFSAARNYAFSKANGDFLMWLDADDVIEEKEIKKLLALKERLDGADTFMLQYHTGELVYYRERILRRSPAACWKGRVHEVIVPFGKVAYEHITITHCKENAGMDRRNLLIYERMCAEQYPFSARDEFYYARELYYDGQYEKSAQKFENFLCREDGWRENKISACEHLAACYLALQNRNEAKRALFHSFLISSPRAEILCKLAEIWFEEREYTQAIFYYRACFLSEYNPKSGGFFCPEYYDFIPCIGLCLCYFRLGDIAEAERWNNRAGEYRPEHPAYLYNVKYFQSLKS